MRAALALALAMLAVAAPPAAASPGSAFILPPRPPSLAPPGAEHEQDAPENLCPSANQDPLFRRLGGPSGPAAVAYHPRGPLLRRTAARPQLHPTGRPGFEPSLGVTRDGSVFVDAAQCELGSSLPVPVVLRSTDGGRRFRDVSPRVNGEHQHPVTQDPYLYVDKRTDRVFTADIADIVPPCAQFGSSADHGRTWTDSVACSLEDHQNIFTGPPPKGGPQPSGYPDVVYYCAIDAGAEAGISKATSCLKSLDGGVTFLRTGEPAYVAPPDQLAPNPTRCDGGTGPGWVDQAGTVYLPRGLCGPPMLAISRDEGQTWTRVKVSNKELGIQVLDGLTLYNHEAGVVGDRAGNLYYTWVAGADRMPYLTISHNGGRTWSRPMMIAPPGVKEAWDPAIDISPAGGLVLAWMGSTNSPGPPFELGPNPSDYKNVTFNGYLTLIPAPLDPNPTLYSTTVNDPTDPFIKGTCEQIRCGLEYDFIDAVAAPDGTAWASFVDACTQTACIGGDLGQIVVGHLARPRP